MRNEKKITREILDERPMGTIDEYLKMYEERDAWPEEAIQRAVTSFKKTEVRKALQKEVDEKGHRLVLSFKVRTAEDSEVQYYIEETLFDPDHYRRLNARGRATVKRECVELINLVERANERFGMGLSVPEEVKTLALEL